jgi:ABC-type transport system substrate-binding protein
MPSGFRAVAPGPRAGPRPAAVLAILVVLVLALAGCTGGEGAGSSGSAGGGGAAPRGRAGGILAIALLDPGPLDPARADGLEDEIVLGNLFDGLTAIDPGGAVRPAVAASWTADKTLRRWEFRLRPVARWADGSPVEAADFVFAWQRLADPEAKPRPAAARTLLAGVRGYRAFATGRAASITGLEAPDPATLRVALDRPFADFPALVAAVPLSPLPAALVRRDPGAYLANPTGNGPFELAGRPRPGRALTLDRNPAYWGPSALLDQVSIHRVPDAQTAWLELQHGRVAFAPVPPDQLAAARTVHGPSADGRTRPGLLQGPTLTTWQLAFDLTSGPARDPRWRQAVSLAVDRQRLADAVAASPATGLVAPATPGYGDPGAAGGSAATPACTACAHDPATARSLFRRAGPGRTPVRLTAPAAGEGHRIATLVAADLAAAGLKLSLTSNPGSPLTLVRRAPAFPRADAALTPWFSDRLLDQARSTPDDPARTTRFRQAEAAILADLPATPLVTDHHAAVLTPGVEGLDLTPWGALDLAAVSLPA